MNDTVKKIGYIVIVLTIVSLVCLATGAFMTRFSAVEAWGTKQEARASACEFMLDHTMQIIDAGIRECPSRVRDPDGKSVGSFIDYACGNKAPLDVMITCEDGGVAVWVLE